MLIFLPHGLLNYVSVVVVQRLAASYAHWWRAQDLENHTRASQLMFSAGHSLARSTFTNSVYGRKTAPGILSYFHVYDRSRTWLIGMDALFDWMEKLTLIMTGVGLAIEYFVRGYRYEDRRRRSKASQRSHSVLRSRKTVIFFSPPLVSFPSLKERVIYGSQLLLTSISNANGGHIGLPMRCSFHPRLNLSLIDESVYFNGVRNHEIVRQEQMETSRATHVLFLLRPCFSSDFVFVA